MLALCGHVMLLTGCYEPRTAPPVTLMHTIQGGAFTMGLSPYKLACGKKEDPEILRCDVGETDEAALEQLTWAPPMRVPSLPTFEVDEHEVTNAQYEYCVVNGVCSPPSSDQASDVVYYGDPKYAEHPVVNVTRAQAMTYCAFLGRSLPSEAQWERAARLGALGEEEAGKWAMRKYPWKDDTPSVCQKGVQRYAVALGGGDLPQPVMYSKYSKGDRTQHKVWDVASNVAEWVRDRWHDHAYCKDRKPYPKKCKDGLDDCKECKDSPLCAKTCWAKKAICVAGTYSEVTSGAAGVVRGGDYLHSRCFHRLFVRRKASGPTAFIGFRCAR